MLPFFLFFDAEIEFFSSLEFWKIAKTELRGFSICHWLRILNKCILTGFWRKCTKHDLFLVQPRCRLYLFKLNGPFPGFRDGVIIWSVKKVLSELVSMHRGNPRRLGSFSRPPRFSQNYLELTFASATTWQKWGLSLFTGCAFLFVCFLTKLDVF